MYDSEAKKGLVLEGGGMRGMYTAGVLDIMMEEGIEVDGLIGVSAGATFGCNFKSRQIGRSVRYNKKYCTDRRYVGIKNWITTGDLYSKSFAYDTLPWELDIFDSETFKNNPVRFWVTCTDINTGEAVYHECKQGNKNDVEWMRASASIPIASKPVKLLGRELLDGGVADSIPVEWFRNRGFKKSIVVLTRPAGYRKQKMKAMPVVSLWLKKYPKLATAISTRHIRYNATLDLIEELEAKGEILVIRPSRAMKPAMIERNAEYLEFMYQMGRHDARKRLKEIKVFFS